MWVVKASCGGVWGEQSGFGLFDNEIELRECVGCFLNTALRRGLKAGVDWEAGGFVRLETGADRCLEKELQSESVGWRERCAFGSCNN